MEVAIFEDDYMIKTNNQDHLHVSSHNDETMHDNHGKLLRRMQL